MRPDSREPVLLQLEEPHQSGKRSIYLNPMLLIVRPCVTCHYKAQQAKAGAAMYVFKYVKNLEQGEAERVQLECICLQALLIEDLKFGKGCFVEQMGAAHTSPLKKVT